MKTSLLILAISAVPAFAINIPVQSAQTLVNESDLIESAMPEFDPTAPNAEQMLELFDQAVEAEGESNWISDKAQSGIEGLMDVGGCYRNSCAVWAHVNKASQSMSLYVNGALVGRYPTSTGVGGRTPNFDKHPDGRIYRAYTSNKYPGGDYNGLGNMPYAVFISGGFAIHGTPRGNWSRLGSPASHGCIRINPSNAQYFNSLVRSYGVRNVWITVN